MSKQLVLILAFAVALSRASQIQPRDLVEQAEEQLQELASLVQGQILAAHNDLSDMGLEFQTHSIDVYERAVVDIQQEESTVDSQLASLKALGESSGHDVTSCTNIREQTLGRLPRTCEEDVSDCIGDVNMERQRVVSDARYLVDIAINKVHSIESQLRRCGDQILCITSIVSEIELNKIRLPQNIQTEVQATQSLLSTLKLSVDSCASTNLAVYVEKASSILNDIIACINRIIES